MRQLLLVVCRDEFRHPLYECRHCHKIKRSAHIEACANDHGTLTKVRERTLQDVKDALKKRRLHRAAISAMESTLKLTDRMIQNGIDLARQCRFPPAMLKLVETKTTTDSSVETQLQTQNEAEQL